jgi:isoleucyl-tRNA synthetase
MLGNISDMKEENIIKYDDMNEIDKYALYCFNDVISQATVGYENYEFHKIVNTINNFCTVFLSGFYLDALKDILYCEKIDSKDRRSAQSAMLEITTILLQLMSPILSFTMQEGWNEIIKIKSGLPKFVTLADFPKENLKYKLDKEVLDKWETLVRIKQQVLVEYEKLRQQKIIGSNLEASLIIKYGSKYSEILKDKDLITIVFGSWDISFELSEQSDEIIVVADKSKFGKCERCWRHIDGINENGLCPRCSEAIK